MKKILSVFLSLLLAFTIIPSGVFSVKGKAASLKEGYYSYTVLNGNARITYVDASISGDIVIPSKLGNYPVTDIWYKVFQDRANITSVKFPSTLKTIGYDAFKGCSSLQTIEFPSSLTNIYSTAFKGCYSLKKVVFNGAVSISASAFSGCSNIKEVHCKTLKDWCNMQFETLESSPLYNNGLIVYSDTYAANLYIDGKILEGNVSIPNGIASLSAIAFSGCTTIKSISIPSSVKQIGRYAFAYCRSLETVEIAEGIRSIESGTFIYTSIKNLYLPNSIEEIKNNAFLPLHEVENLHIKSLKSWVMVNNEDIVANHLYENGTLLSGRVAIPFNAGEPNCERLGNGIFVGNDDITFVLISPGYETIGASAFASCSSLENVYLPNTVKTLEVSAFYSCNALKKVYYEHGSAREMTIDSNNTSLINASWIHQHAEYSSKYVPSAPTCTEGATRDTYCACGIIFRSENVNPLGHLFAKDKVVAPTFSEKGYTLYKCTRCSATEKRNYTTYQGSVKVSNVVATASDVDIKISWDAYEGASGYYVRIRNGANTQTITNVHVTKGTSHTFTTSVLNYNTDYIFQVIAYVGTNYQKWDNADSIKSKMVITNRVVGLTATIDGKGAVVNFLPVPKAQGYYAFVYEADTMKKIDSIAVDAGATSVVINRKLDAGQNYIVKITPKLNGSYVSGVETTGVGVKFTAPIVHPTSYIIADQTPTSIRFNWDAVRGVDEYYIRVKEKATGKLVNTLHTTNGKTTATLARYTDGTRISPNTTYTLEFCAYISGIKATYGAPVDITTEKFETISVNAAFDIPNVKITWSTTQKSVGYYVYRIKNGSRSCIAYIEGKYNNSLTVKMPSTSGKYSYGVIAIESNTSGKAYVPIAISNSMTIS